MFLPDSNFCLAEHSHFSRNNLELNHMISPRVIPVNHVSFELEPFLCFLIVTGSLFWISMLIFDHQALVNFSKKSSIGFLRRLRISPPVLGILLFAGITSGAVEEAACGVATENKRDHCKDRQTVTWWDERVPGRNTLFVYFPSPVHGQSPAFENWRIFINIQSFWKRPMNYEPISVTSNFLFTVFLVMKYFIMYVWLFFKFVFPFFPKPW